MLPNIVHEVRYAVSSNTLNQDDTESSNIQSGILFQISLSTGDVTILSNTISQLYYYLE